MNPVYRKDVWKRQNNVCKTEEKGVIEYFNGFSAQGSSSISAVNKVKDW